MTAPVDSGDGELRAKKYPMPGKLKGTIYGTPKISSILAWFEASIHKTHRQSPDGAEWDEVRLEAATRIMQLIAQECAAREAEVHRWYQHAEKLRHAVRVGHWNSKCNNCHFDKLTGTETTCPQCKWAFHYVYTEYVGEEEAAHKVFPHLELIGFLPQLTQAQGGQS